MDTGNNANGLSFMSSSSMDAGKQWIMIVACVYVFTWLIVINCIVLDELDKYSDSNNSTEASSDDDTASECSTFMTDSGKMNVKL